MRNKVLLYNPKSEFYAMPLGLLAVGSALDRRRFEVVIVDGRIASDGHAQVLHQLDGALCLGMTVFTGAPIRDALDLAARVRERFPTLPIVWGGWHPSILPEQCLRSGLVDVVVRGQGEATFAEIICRMAQGQGLRGCLGCLFTDGKSITDNGPRPFLDVNSFPPADYGLFNVLRYFERKGQRQLDYCSSRGCPYQCTFCADPQVYGGRWSGLSPERVDQELSALHATYGFEEVFFLDDDLFANRKRLSALCHLLCKSKPRFGWKGTARADELCRLSDDELAGIRHSGCRRINVGAESGSQTVLNKIKKKYRVDNLVDAGQRCHRHGIRLTYSFIAGFPGEPESALSETTEVITTLKRIDPDFETPIYLYAPYPGTELAEELKQMGWHPADTLEEWTEFDIRRKRYPWISAGYARRVRNLNFYLQKAYPGSRHRSVPRRILAAWARRRLHNGAMALAFERHAFDALARGVRLFRTG